MLAFDLRDAVRGLTRDRLYSLVAVLTLALTTGATTAVFSIVDGVLLRPLAYRESRQLVVVNEVVREFAGQYPMLPVNARHFDRWREKASSFASIAAYRDAPANLTGLGEAAQILAVRTSGTLFDVLQVQPALGRLLTRADEAQDQPRVAVVSDALWRERMQSDPSVVGRAIVLDGVQHTVIGVLPADVKIPLVGQLTGPGQLTTKVEVIVPLRLNLQDLSLMGDFNYAVIGRLQKAIGIAAARAELDVLQADLAREAAAASDQTVGLRSEVRPLDESIVGAARRGLLLLLAAIAGVLLIACSNLANLSLTRTLARLRDAAIRTALGATRRRLIARVVLEQLILAIVGGVLGIGVASAALRLFVVTAPIDLPRAADVAINGRVLAFAAIVSTMAGFTVALVPAWRIAHRDVQEVLRSGSGTTADPGGLRARSALLTLQIALSVALLAITALLTVSFMKLLQSDRGFSTDGVVAIDMSLPANRYAEPAKLTAAYDRLLEQVQAIPGVSSASWVSVLPLTGENWVDVIAVEGDPRPFAQMPTANYRFVAPDYFKTMGITLTRGRSFTAEERGDNAAVLPAVITARTAATLWPGLDPIGRRFLRGDPKQKPFEVVGVIGDGRNTRIDGVSPLMVYVPYWFRSRVAASLVVRTPVGLGAVASDIRRVVGNFDPDIAIASVRPMQQLVDDALASRRYQVTVLIAFGAIALLIATIGVYAVTAYGISRRRREMNIRVALGATSRSVLGLILRQGTAPLVVGIALGITAALGTGAAVESLLFDVSARDPRVIAAIAALVGFVGLAAALAAIRQGLMIDPAAALRDE
jgi:putative ABC transport system permease protein